MKKHLMSIVFGGFLVLASTQLYAKDKGSGCGLGSQVWGGQSGLISHLSAGTTNGTSANQTFGLTSGTSGCDAGSTVQNETKQKIFLADNMDYLFEDMSQGKGEFLTAYGQLLGCDGSSMAEFSQKMQTNHEVVFSGEESIDSVLENTKGVIQSDERLSQSCVAMK